MIRLFFVVFAFFESKKIHMNKIAGKFIQMVLALSVVSCGVSEIGDFVKDEANGIWTGPSSGGSSASRSITYVTAFDYPDGYDWRNNPEKGSVRCSLVVFANGMPVLKVPVGNAYNVSDDLDMHRVINGHLYTDFTTDNETVIKKDGKPYLSFEGRESITSMIVQSDSVYTLGQKRNGKGFSYRANGRVVLERDKGYTFGRLVSVDDDICFAFAEPIETSGERLQRYYCFMNGSVVQTALREDIKEVWDIGFHDGEVCVLTSLTGVSDPVMIKGKEMYTLPLPYGATIMSGQLFSVGNQLGVEMMLSSRSGLFSTLWLSNKIYRSFVDMKTVSSMWSGDEGVACVLNGRTASVCSSVFRMGEYFELPSGFSCQGNSIIDLTDGILTVGLSSLSGSKPIIWKDGKIEELDVNGYICTVSSVAQSSQVRVLD